MLAQWPVRSDLKIAQSLCAASAMAQQRAPHEL